MLDTLWNLTLAALGIGLVIFVHEAGHFLAARWCKVRVEVFSLGFGPKLLGWKRGDTLYQIAAVPLGGYVKMAGEDVYDPDAARRDDDLGSKSVPQRFLIFSGGVIMNMIFALVVFPIILLIGVPLDQPLIDPAKGGPAWEAGLEPGTVVEEIEGDPVYTFMHIPNGIALADHGSVSLKVRLPGAETSRIVEVTPAQDERQGLYTIAVDPAVDPDHTIVVFPDSTAARAGLRTGDRLAAVESAYEGQPLLEAMEFAKADAGPLRATFVGVDGTRRDVELEPDETIEGATPIFGVGPVFDRVAAVRRSPLTDELGLAPDDRITDVCGSPLLRMGDPLRILADREEPVTFTILRDERTRSVDLGVLSREERVRLADDIALTGDLESARVSVSVGSPAWKAGLRSGDELVEIDGTTVEDFEGITAASRLAAKEDRAAELHAVRLGADGATEELELSVRPAPYLPNYGFGLKRAEYVYQASSPIDAVRVGFVSSWRLIEDAFVTLKGIFFTDRISGQNLGGIITIATVATNFADSGITKLLFFLCLLSVNLAFLNVLPIPVLDGGQLMFLLIEAIKGSPVSEKVMSYSQLVGLVLIVSLMIYVIKNDIVRMLQ